MALWCLSPFHASCVRVISCLTSWFLAPLACFAAAAAVELAQQGAYLTLRNAKIDMYRGSMRLAVDQWGKVEALEGASFKANVSTGAGRAWGAAGGGCPGAFSCMCSERQGPAEPGCV